MIREIRTYQELKALCVLNNISLLEFPKQFGYKSLWGFRQALKNERKSKELWKEVNKFFYKK